MYALISIVNYWAINSRLEYNGKRQKYRKKCKYVLGYNHLLLGLA